MFGFELLRGNSQTALAEPYSVVLTERMAEKYFGPDDNPMGKTIQANGYGEMHELTVTGVAKNPANTHLRFDFLASFSTLRSTMPDPESLGSWRHIAQRRTKEIGIRKAMGASTRDIVQLLSTNFAKLVLVAIAVAVPASWYAARQWLDGFAYRVELGPWVFAGAGAAALLVALLTVSYHALRAAWANPADALRDE